MDYFGCDESSFICCEVCDDNNKLVKAVDIHHISCKGMGGDPQKKKDVIENIMAVCRSCHEKYGDKTQWKDYLKEIHLRFMSKV